MIDWLTRQPNNYTMMFATKWNRTAFLYTLICLAAAILAQPALAAQRVYNITTAQSSIAISGTVTRGSETSPIQSQGPGSLTTSYSGTIRTDRGPGTIQFLPGSSIDANISGSWQPMPDGSAGVAPADYGGRVSFLFGLISANVAARDFIADFSSGAVPVDGAGDFSLGTTTVSFINGSIAYRASIGAAGSDTVVGESAMLEGTASLSTQIQSGDSVETLSIPIDSSFAIAVDATTTVNLNLAGQLVAIATLPPTLAGDFNDDGAVDAADYVVWRKNTGGTYTQADFNTWRANFGEASGAGARRSASAVPEPADFSTMAAMLLALCCFCREHRA
jgi:hypothetical protein